MTPPSWVGESSLLAVAPLVLSTLVAVVVFLIPDPRTRARTTVNVTGAAVKLLIVVTLVPAVVAGARPEWRSALLPGIDLILRVEPLSLLFAGLSSLLWLLTTIYAIGYLEGRPHRARFFGFFSLCVTATVGISFSGNVVTFLLFFELLTLVTYPAASSARRTTGTAVRPAGSLSLIHI